MLSNLLLNNAHAFVIVCAQPRVQNGKREYFAGFSSGDYGWISDQEFGGLHLRDYRALPKIR